MKKPTYEAIGQERIGETFRDYLERVERGEPANFLIEGPNNLRMPVLSRSIFDARQLAHQYIAYLGQKVVLQLKTSTWGNHPIDI